MGFLKVGVFLAAGVFLKSLWLLAVLIRTMAIPGATLGKKIANGLPTKGHLLILDLAIMTGGIILLLDVIKQMTERGYSAADVSKRLGVSRHSLCGWIKRYAALPGTAGKEDQSAEIRRLKQELARVIEERDILKKATVYFARDAK